MKQCLRVLFLLALAGCKREVASGHGLVVSDASRATIDAASLVIYRPSPEELRAVMDASAAQKLSWHLISGSKPKRFFKPELADVLALEERLPEGLRKHAPPHFYRGADAESFLERAPGYRRQYYGFVDDRGVHRIWANFFCVLNMGRALDYWKTEQAGAIDGGDCFFHVKYVIKTGSFEDLTINEGA